MKLRLYQHSFFHYNGVDYKDYTIALYSEGYQKFNYVVGLDYYQKLTDTKELCDDSFKPTLGDEIHVVPDCALATQDIRNSYKIKRGYDQGICNVFSPIAGKYFRKNRFDTIKIIPFKKLAIVCDYDYNKERYDEQDIIENVLIEAQSKLVIDEIINETDLYCADNILTFNAKLNLCFCNASESYLHLLLGDSKKPCVYYENLPMRRLECTPDVVMMTYKIGKNYYLSDNIKKFRMQLMLLSQYNWKDYPGTFGILFYDMIYYYMFRTMRCHSSGEPKPVKEILEYPYETGEFKDEKDKALFSEFVEQLLQVGDKKFVTYRQMIDKLNLVGLNMDNFLKVYDVNIKITPSNHNEAKV